MARTLLFHVAASILAILVTLCGQFKKAGKNKATGIEAREL
jgi:hypothetical protein